MTARLLLAAVLAVFTFLPRLGLSEELRTRLPEGVIPQVGAWFWNSDDLKPGAYKEMLDVFAEHSPYIWLPTSTRQPVEITEEAFFEQVKKASKYAKERGLKMCMDIDPRLARGAFQKRFPEEMQQVVRLEEAALGDSGVVTIESTPISLHDHMTGGTKPYASLEGDVLRVYTYVKGPEGIDPSTIEDVTAACRAGATTGPEKVAVRIGCDASTKGRHACLLAVYTHFTPAVFALHLIPFQRELVEKYAQTDLAGASKDEWGFPPSYGRLGGNDFWYSTFYADAYRKATEGRDLVRDMLLMFAPHRGETARRNRAINTYNLLNYLRNAEIEDTFYRDVKRCFGPESGDFTHATWYPRPCKREFKKNGLHWWRATRDLPQTDESTPWCCRTSLAKRFDYPVCFNQFYHTHRDRYFIELWSSVLAGGRINYHPIYPRPKNYTERGFRDLLRGDLMRADCRVRMLNFISKTPVDCPVALIFGHACAANWTQKSFGDCGLALAASLRAAGYPADLIPSSEIGRPELRIGAEGALWYGPQRYEAVVLFEPQFEGAATSDLIRTLLEKDKTAVVRLGDWSVDADGTPLPANRTAPRGIALADSAEACRRRVVAEMERRGVERQNTSVGPPSIGVVPDGTAHPLVGECRLIDGTRIHIAAKENRLGDPIKKTLDIGGRKIEVDAVGLVAVRLDEAGKLDAFAAGGLKRISTDGFALELPERVDIVFWHDENGTPRGAVQDWEGPLPACLTGLTENWVRIETPVPCSDAKPGS